MVFSLELAGDRFIRTRRKRALVVLAVVSVILGGGVEYGFGKRPLHPTEKFYYLWGGEPLGIPLPWHNDNPLSQNIYDERCRAAKASFVHHRHVSMCVDDIMRPDLRIKHKSFSLQVDEDFRRYWREHAQKAGWSSLYAVIAWLLVVGIFAVFQWVVRGETASTSG